MIEKIGFVRNPLTVIAMFAGIAEVSGTVVLPFLKPETQQVYVWFLMAFPCLLVLLFFGTLLWKHHVLYAPSDFKDEKLFASMFLPGSSDLRFEKLQEEVATDTPTDAESGDANQPDVPPEGASSAKAHSDDSRPTVEPAGADTSYRHSIIARASLAEDLVVTQLASEHGVNFVRNVSPASMPHIMFDAVGMSGEKEIVVEVKYSSKGNIPRAIFERHFGIIRSFYDQLSSESQRRFLFIFAVVLGDSAEADQSFHDGRYSSWTQNPPFPTQVRVFRMSELEASARSA